MGLSEEQWDELVAAVYDAPPIEDGWQRAMTLLSQAIGNSSIIFRLQPMRINDVGSIQAIFGIDPSYVENFMRASGAMRSNPLMMQAGTIKIWGAFSFRRVTSETCHRTNSFLRHEKSANRTGEAPGSHCRLACRVLRTNGLSP